MRPIRSSEAGFTLVELLVVMLILGVLAAIAIPSFFNQSRKANDAQAKSMVHSAQVAMETYASDNNGVYSGSTLTVLKNVEPTLNIATSTSGPYLPSAPVTTSSSYSVTVQSPATGNQFTAARSNTGAVSYTCTAGGQGGCPAGGSWGS